MPNQKRDLSGRITKNYSGLLNGPKVPIRPLAANAAGTKPHGKKKNGKVSNQLAGGTVHVQAHTRHVPGAGFKKMKF